MINHEYLELFNQSSIRKNIDIAYDTDSHITNRDVVSGSFSLNESGFATKELRFGSLVSSQLSVKLYNTVPNLMDKQLDVSIVVDNIASNPLKIGKYKVLEDKPTTDRLYKQIKAYDSLYEVINKEVVSWYEGLLFPMTLKVFRDSFFNYLGIEQVDIALVNDDMLIEKTITATSIPGKQVLSAICEINGAIGRMNREGKFVYVVLDANPTNRITIDNIASKSGSYEDFECQPISKVQIRQTTNDIGAIVGNNGNTYIVQDNFLVYGKSSADLNTIATNLLSVIEGITYTPFNIKAIYGNPCYEVGDAITVVTTNKTFNSYIFNRTLKGIQAMTDNIKADGVEYYTENLNSANNQIQQLSRQTNELSRTVEETKSTITSIEVVAEEANQNAQEALDNVGEAYDKATEALGLVGGFDERITKNESSITQNAENIETKVSKGEIISSINQSAEEVRIQADKIKLEGTVTANDNFKILEDGSMESIAGTIGGFRIGETLLETEGLVLYSQTDDKDAEIYVSGDADVGDTTTSITASNGVAVRYMRETDGKMGDVINLRMVRTSLDDGTTGYGGSLQLYGTSMSTREQICNINLNGSTGEVTALGAIGSSTNINATKELRAGECLRLTRGNYGALLYPDTDKTLYLLLTNKNDKYGSQNSLRPFKVDMSTGKVTMGHGLDVTGDITTTGFIRSAFELQCTGSNGLRLAYGNNIGFLIRYDGSNTYFMFTNSKDPYGSYNSLRPITINNTTGQVSMGHAVTVGGALTVNGNSISGSTSDNLKFISSAGSIVTQSAGGLYVAHQNGLSGGYRNVHAAAFTQMSSKKTKENVVNITEEEASKILDVNVVSFDYKENFGGQKNNFGVIAEDVIDVIPSAVNVPDGYDENNVDDDNVQHMLGVDYSKFVPHLIKMVQIQQKEIEELKSRLEKVENSKLNNQ